MGGAGSFWVEGTPQSQPSGPPSATPCWLSSSTRHTHRRLHWVGRVGAGCSRGSSALPAHPARPAPAPRSSAMGPAVRASPPAPCAPGSFRRPLASATSFLAGTRQVTSFLPLCGAHTPSCPLANEAIRGLSQGPRASSRPGHLQTAGPAGPALPGSRSGQTAESRSPASLSREGVTRATFTLEPPVVGAEDRPAQAGGSRPALR